MNHNEGYGDSSIRYSYKKVTIRGVIYWEPKNGKLNAVKLCLKSHGKNWTK